MTTGRTQKSMHNIKIQQVILPQISQLLSLLLIRASRRGLDAGASTPDRLPSLLSSKGAILLPASIVAGNAGGSPLVLPPSEQLSVPSLSSNASGSIVGTSTSTEISASGSISSLIFGFAADSLIVIVETSRCLAIKVMVNGRMLVF